MRFIVSKTKLEEDLKVLSKIVSGKNPLPILNDILFKVKNDTLILVASDGDVWITTQIKLSENKEGDGQVAVDCEFLRDALRQIIEQPIEISVSADNTLVLTHSVGKFYFPVEEADTFPETRKASEVTSEVSVKASLVKNAIDRCIFACSSDELRPVMNGVCFDFKSDMMNITASNGHILALTKNTKVSTDKPACLTFPKNVCAILSNILDGELPLKLNYDDNVCIATFGDMQIAFRLVDGKYPNYMSVIPNKFSSECVIDRTCLLNGVKSVSPFTNDSSNLIKFGFGDDKLMLEGEDCDCSKGANYEVTCSVEGKKMDIGLKGSDIVSLLTKIDHPSVKIQYNDPTHALIFSPEENADDCEVLFLSMPMLIKD